MPEFKEIPQANPERQKDETAETKPVLKPTPEARPEKPAPFRPSDARLDLVREAGKIVPEERQEIDQELSPAMKIFLERLEHASPEEAKEILNEVLSKGDLPPNEQSELLGRALDRVG